MVEGQSRYGIMQELNNRKVNEKEKLANIEKETDAHVFEEDKKIAQIDEEIKSVEKNYKIDFKDREQQRKVNLKMITLDFERTKKMIEEAMKDDVDNYEKRFQDWKQNKLDMKKLLSDELSRYKTLQDKKVKDKVSIIVEIEAGITSLKEMSKEQKE